VPENHNDEWVNGNDWEPDDKIEPFHAAGWGCFEITCVNCGHYFFAVAEADLPMGDFWCPKCHNNPYILNFEYQRKAENGVS
jgi:hypothetical protein